MRWSTRRVKKGFNYATTRDCSALCWPSLCLALLWSQFWLVRKAIRLFLKKPQKKQWRSRLCGLHCNQFNITSTKQLIHYLFSFQQPTLLPHLHQSCTVDHSIKQGFHQAPTLRVTLYNSTLSVLTMHTFWSWKSLKLMGVIGMVSPLHLQLTSHSDSTPRCILAQWFPTFLLRDPS